MGIVIMFLGGGPILISAIIFLIAVSRRGLNYAVFFGAGFASFVVLATITFCFFSALDPLDNSAGGPGDHRRVVGVVLVLASLPGVSSIIAWVAASSVVKEIANNSDDEKSDRNHSQELMSYSSGFEQKSCKDGKPTETPNDEKESVAEVWFRNVVQFALVGAFVLLLFRLFF